ncbi:unnamed protein product [Owenia fusiformis]|uniref:Uncharacterized protein n=1 Tax=Owenia fusiformis TaxID=6347 RepID=A0A8S4PB93_OWEFU|nr:unnamed protein product [Owenia fusiformis]
MEEFRKKEMEKLNIVMNSIIFTQDMNESSKTEDVLGDKIHHFVKKDMGATVFSGSLAEGTAFLGISLAEESNYDMLDHVKRFDVDIMYEDKDFIAMEQCESLASTIEFVNIIHKLGCAPLLIKPSESQNLMCVRIDMPIPIMDFERIVKEKASSRKEVKIGWLEINEFQKIEPSKLKNYTGHFRLVPKLSRSYLLNFLTKLSSNKHKCECRWKSGHNRYGDLCDNCKAESCIMFRENGVTTEIWTDQRRIRGPAVNEVVFIANTIHEIPFPRLHLGRNIGKYMSRVYIDSNMGQPLSRVEKIGEVIYTSKT